MPCTRTCPAGEQPGTEGPDEGPGAGDDQKRATCPWDRAATGGASPMGGEGAWPLLSTHLCPELGSPVPDRNAGVSPAREEIVRGLQFWDELVSG